MDIGNWFDLPGKEGVKESRVILCSKKVAWYYRAEEYKTTGSKKTLDEIREKYGSETVNSRRQAKVLQQ